MDLLKSIIYTFYHAITILIIRFSKIYSIDNYSKFNQISVAINNNDFDSFKRLLNNDLPKDIINNIFYVEYEQKYCTLLTYVCYKNINRKWIKLIFFVLQRKQKYININKPTKDFFGKICANALAIAVDNGNYYNIKYLMKHPKIKLNIKNYYYGTPFNYFFVTDDIGDHTSDLKLFYTNRRVNFDISKVHIHHSKHQHTSYKLYKRSNYTILTKSNYINLSYSNEEYM